jgi:hypothetical protein
MNEFKLAFAFVIATLILLLLIVVFEPKEGDGTGTSPSTGTSSLSGSPVRVGYLPKFNSQKTIISSDPSKTFNYVSNPLSDGTSGYLVYNKDSNMLRWPVSLPLNFTHAVFNQNRDTVFKFNRPNTSDTSGSFVNGTIPNNFLITSLELGTF